MQLFNSIKKSLKDYVNYLFFCEYRFRRTVRRHLRKYYTPDAARATNDRQQVIVMFDGRYAHHGLAYRLRGIVSIYEYCKENKFDFRIHFTAPFRLETYLEPAAYDWRIDDEELSYNEKDSCAVFIDSYQPRVEREKAFQRRITKRFLATKHKQIHVYTNAFFAEERFGALFCELFRPTEMLQSLVDKHIAELGGDGRYIAVSTRFLELLGDFCERRDQPARGLPDSEREALIERCCLQIERIRDEHPEIQTILATSDSTRFLERAAKIDKVRILPGEIGHMDIVGGDKADVHVKTFLDFLVLSQAAEVNLLVSGRMYRSNFSHRAAQIHNKPFHEIFF